MRTHDITFPCSTRRPMRAAIAVPDDGQRHPAVIVIHEVFGLNDDIRRIARRLCNLGYVTLAPDLYDRGSMRPICIARTMLDLARGQGRALDDLEAARQFLADQESVDPSRIGVIGFCMGGGFALLYAVHAPLSVAAPFYGEVPKTADGLRGICPVLGSYGGRDRFFASQGERLEKLLTELGIQHDVKIYPEAGHSFMSDNRGILATLGKYGPLKAAYNPAAAEDAWKRIESFFAQHLKSAGSLP